MASEELQTLFKPEGQQMDMTDYLMSSSGPKADIPVLLESLKEEGMNDLHLKDTGTGAPQRRIRHANKEVKEEQQATLF